MKLPKPECSGGYTHRQLDEILGLRRAKFDRWMAGQTRMYCDARLYDVETQSYKPSGCDRPHGEVTYPWDVERFLAGLPVID
jgi:hypothetical protein